MRSKLLPDERTTSIHAQGADPPPQQRRTLIARMAHSVSYGWLSQCMLTMDPPLEEQLARGGRPSGSGLFGTRCG
jgi:hypothetical protein